LSTLFRPEALQHREDAWLGQVTLVRPPALAWLVALAAAAALAVGGFLVFGQAARKVRVAGVLTPTQGVIRLLAPEPGVIAESRVSEGMKVDAGDTLFVVSTEHDGARGGTQAAVQATLDTRSASLQQAGRQRLALLAEQDGALKRQTSDLQREAAQIDAQLELHQQRLALAAQAQARYASLQAEQFVSAAQVQTKTEELLALRAQGEALLRDRAVKARELAAVDAQRRELPLRAQAASGEIERDVAALAQLAAESEGRRQRTVRAPQAGTISGLTVAAGQPVTPASALATLLPAGATLQADLYAPSSAVGFIRSGQTVQLRYQAFPFQKFGHHPGRVLQVSRTPLQATELAALPMVAAPGAEPLYRITVALDAQAVQAFGEAQPLAAGMQLDADVLLERRRLIEWAFEPLLSLSGRW